MENPMKIEFIPVSADNIAEIEQLTVKPDQSHFIETTKQCLSEAANDSRWHPAGIYIDKQLCGFTMYGCFTEDSGESQVWLDRFFIGSQYQGNGYASASLPLLIELLEKQYSCQTIYLSIIPGNHPAVSLYEKFGFTFNGETDCNGEQIMVRTSA